MAEDMFEIMSRLPMFADAMTRYKTPEELDAEALAYVQSKWWEAEMWDLKAHSSDILRVQRDEETCAKCTGAGKCPLNYHPLTLSAEEKQGQRAYVVRVGKCGSDTAQETRNQGQFEDLLKASGLSAKQQKQTFEAYVSEGLGADVRNAELQAIRAAMKGEWLVLAGKRGTGKSHLAVAIMLNVMGRGIPALFRSVPEMLDELRDANRNNTYHAKMKQLKDVSCLVLDDLGKERATETDTGVEYLFQILDFRYRNDRQTIVTTNALDQSELVRWSKEEYFVPLLSRLNEMGAWCAIKTAGDYRGKLGETKKLPLGAA